ncbi:hypothetical protein AB0H88_06110 [Nonomuraea sp. NPDC050680]|uniref:hypothetical protein n=1 Tax=Nonomuraea sp. NPDC050680 TaxID=3154630 RepID=UPI0033FF99F2
MRNMATSTTLAMTFVLLLSACGQQAHWFGIEFAKVSEDGHTITATFMTSPPDSKGVFCTKVTNTALAESPTQVTIGIEVRNDCEPLFPWEKGRITSAVAYPREQRFLLKEPLAGRRLVDQATHQDVFRTK